MLCYCANALLLSTFLYYLCSFANKCEYFAQSRKTFFSENANLARHFQEIWRYTVFSILKHIFQYIYRTVMMQNICIMPLVITQKFHITTRVFNMSFLERSIARLCKSFMFRYPSYVSDCDPHTKSIIYSILHFHCTIPFHILQDCNAVARG